jgi:drug/metabolite transporter (DMT)-like permease
MNMPNGSLSAIGLTIAALMSGANVLTDVARKKALRERSLIPATFWCRVVAAAVFTVALLARIVAGRTLTVRDGGDLFGINGIHVSPIETFLIYLFIDIVIVSFCNLLYFLALQVSPMSVCIPFLAFTPIFLIPMGYIVLGELPARTKLLGVALVVVGSVVMHRRLFALGWLAPFRAIVTERGSRYMLIVAFLFSLSNPIEKKLVLMSGVYTQAFAYGLGLCVFFGLLSLARHENIFGAIRKNVWWIGAAGLLDGVSLLLQFAAYKYIDVVITVSIKRAGIVLAVFSGWLFFHERGITDKIIAASIMFAGVLILYLPLTPVQAIAMSALALLAMALALYLTRNQNLDGETVPLTPPLRRV